MHFIAENLKYIRKTNGLTQEQLAVQLGVKRSLIGAYEEGRSDPRISFIMHVCTKFGYSMDQFVGKALDGNDKLTETYKGGNLRILPILVDSESNTERAALVPVQAAAGYLNGLADVEYIESLPFFDLPFPELSRGKTYRIFQIRGESMLPIPSGSYILGSYVLDWNNIKNDGLYILVSRSEGIVFKRVLNNLKDRYLRLKSDNPEFSTYDLPAEDIAEVWMAEGVTTIGFNQEAYPHFTPLLNELSSIRNTLTNIQKQISKD